MIATVASASLLGADGEAVAVEVHVSAGLPGFTIVGLPDAACREARDRVRAALLSSGLPWPLRRVTVNLAPSSMRKVGAGLDLPIAVGLLAATGELAPGCIEGCGFLGELGLDGSLRTIPGTLALVSATRARAVVVPVGGLGEARLVEDRRAVGARSLREVVDALRGDGAWVTTPAPVATAPPAYPLAGLDLAHVCGQKLGRHALEVAAAGGHHLLLVGAAGAGKTMLARCLPGLLPPLAPEEALEVRRVHSAAGALLPGDRRPPFRAPHHSASPVALIGGGSSTMRPGEVSLAHHGVLFLDELGEFAQHVLETLRQPLEEGVVRVARLRGCVTYPARFLLVAATNPCPCGEGTVTSQCRCTPADRSRYHRRLSGPLLDRFDLQVVVHAPPVREVLGRAGRAAGGHGNAVEGSATVARRVADARARARARGWRCNADVPAERLDDVAPLSAAACDYVVSALEAGSVSARTVARLRLVALTLADLAGADTPLSAEQLQAARSLRVGRPALVGTR